MKKYIIPFLTLGLVCSCVDDEGNYDITHMNQVSIDGMESRYSLLSYIDYLEIDPKIEGSIYGEDESNYEYKWVLCHDAHTHDIIGNERKLSWRADMPEGSYTVALTVKDKNTDLERIFTTSVTTSSPFTTGFLILGRDMSTGKAALDMLAMPPNRDSTIVENVIDMSAMNVTEPKSLIVAGKRYGLTAARIWLNSDDNSYCLLSPESESVSDIRNLGDATSEGFIELDMPHEKQIVIRDMFPRQTYSYGTNWNRSYQYRGYITNDVIVFASSMMSEYFAQPCNRYSSTSEQLFKPFPFAFCPGATRTGANSFLMFYDMDNDCFVKPATGYGASSSIAVTSYATAPWNFNLKADNRKLVYGENGFEASKGNSYAIVRKAEDDGTRYIYKFSISYTVTQSPLYTVDPAVAPDFEKATHYMFSSNRTAVLYSIGNRLYQYDYARGKCEHYDFPAEITLLKSDFVSNGDISEYFVATYSDQDKGMIYKMTVPNNPNAIEFEFCKRTDPETNEMVNMQWPTRLKVTDIEWKTN